MRHAIPALLVGSFLFAVAAAAVDLTSSDTLAAAGEAAGTPMVAGIGGRIGNVAVIGDHAYLGSGTRILVLDVSDPAQPVLVGRSDPLPRPVHHLAVDGGRLYGAGGFVTTFDLADPLRPRPLGMIGAGACRVVPNGRYLYPLAGCGGFPLEHVIDALDPARPSFLGEMPFSQPHEDLVVAGDTGYAIYNVFLQLLDMRDPSAPRKAGEIDTDPHGLNRLVYDAPMLYAATDRGLVRYDASLPMYPVPAAAYDAGERGLALAERSGTACLVTASGLSTLDATQPVTIALRGHVDVPGAVEVTLVDHYAYVSGAEGVTVVDVGDPDHPAVTARVPVLGTAYEVALAADVALVAAGDAGLAVVGLADPTEPRLLASLAVGFPAEMIAVEAGRAYLVGPTERLYPEATRVTLAVVDVTAPAAPTLTGSLTLAGLARDVAASAGMVYIAGAGGAAAVIDARDAAAPHHLASVPSDDLTPNELLADAGALYLVESDRVYDAEREAVRETARLRLFDVAALPQVRELGVLDFDSRVESRGMVLSGNRMYVPASRAPIYRMFAGEGREDLLAIDVSDPGRPRSLGFVALDGYAKDIAVVGDTAYVAAGRDEFRFDVQQGESLIALPGFDDGGGPRARWVVDLPAVPRSVAVGGDRAVLALREGGLAVVDVRPEVLGQATSTPTPSSVAPPTNTAGPGTTTATPRPTSTPVVARTPTAMGSPTWTPRWPASATPASPATSAATATPPSPATGGTPPDGAEVTFRRLGQYGGESRAAAVYGDFVLLGLGSRVEVLDMSDAATPAKVGQAVVPGIVSALVVDAGRRLACVTETNGPFRVLDLSEIARPREIASLQPPTALRRSRDRLVAHLGHVYLATDDGIGVVDVSLPTAPRWVGTTSAAGAVTDLTLAGERLYVTSQLALEVFELADPARPTQVGSAAILPELGELGVWAVSVAVVGPTAYVAAWAYEEWFGAAQSELDGAARRRPQAPAAAIPTLCFVLAFDVGDPSTPVEVGRFDASQMMEHPGRLASLGHRLFLEASAYAGPWTTYGVRGEILGFDIAQPHEPRLLGQFDWHPDVGSDIVAAWPRLYVPEWHGGLRTLDASAPLTPTLLSTYDAPFVPRAIAAEEGRIALGDHGTGGMWAIDARERDRAGAEGHLALGLGACGAGCEVEMQDGIVFMADENDGLFVLDSLNPGPPRLLSRLEDLGHGSGRGVALAVDGITAYVGTTKWQTAMEPELTIVDVADPSAPRISGRVALPAEVADIAYADGLVHAATAAGLVVVRVAEPASPAVVGTLAVGGSSVAASGRTVYLVERNGTFHVVDVSDSTRPVEVGWMDKAREDDVRPNTAYEMRSAAGTVYVMHQKWLQAIDVRDPRSPRELGWIPAAELGTDQGFAGMALDVEPIARTGEVTSAPGHLLYLASQQNGIFIVEAQVGGRSPEPILCTGCRLWLPAVAGR